MRRLLPLLLVTSAWAGPWTRGPGEAYLKLEQGLFVADEYVNPSGQSPRGSEYFGTTTSLYAEVGLGAGLQAVLLLPWQVAVNTRPGGNRYLRSGGGDASAALQWSSPWLDLPHALRLDVKVPLYDTTPSSQEGTFFPNAGDGQLDGTLWLSAGGSAGALYGLGEVGYRLRTEGFGDSIPWFGQVGYRLWGIIFAANVSGVAPLVEDDMTKGYLDLGPSIYAPVGGGLALEARYGATLWATHASKGHGAGLGVSYDLR